MVPNTLLRHLLKLLAMLLLLKKLRLAKKTNCCCSQTVSSHCQRWGPSKLLLSNEHKWLRLLQQLRASLQLPHWLLQKAANPNSKKIKVFLRNRSTSRAAMHQATSLLARVGACLSIRDQLTRRRASYHLRMASSILNLTLNSTLTLLRTKQVRVWKRCPMPLMPLTPINLLQLGSPSCKVQTLPTRLPLSPSSSPQMTISQK